MDIFKQAKEVYQENFDNKTCFERALFFSWYCKLGDCKFCYMSTVKDKNTDPKKARRRFSSILAEAIISKALGWKIEFVSGGYESYTKEELVFLVKNIHKIMDQKLWLNIGTLSKEELELFKPYIEGYAGTIESVNWEVRKDVCPSKHLEPILETFGYCDELGLKKAMTLIIGLGETIEDFKNLEEFVKEQNISRITFYALNPHEETCFTKSPPLDYYSEWIAKTRVAFPKIDIIAGAWIDKTAYYKKLLESGANAITKLPSVRKFASEEFKHIEEEVKLAGREFQGSLTKMPDVDWNAMVDSLDIEDKLKLEIKDKLDNYLNTMKKNCLKYK